MTQSIKVNRRGFVGTALAAAAIRPQSVLSTEEDQPRYQLFWGDLHNHNAVGYAKGTLERSIDVAREHLDFFAFTGHAWWHDMPHMPNDRHLKWVRGFEVHKQHWPKTRHLIREANSDRFVALLGYEWHSSQFGDYCLIFPDDQPDLFLPDHVEKLLDFARRKNALAIPHHLAYARGWRGANFDHYRQSVSPIVEIFSEHGCSESDRAPQPFIRHSMGGRSTANTVIPQLQKGLRFGFVASSDNHRGYPGAFGEGVLGVWATELTRSGLFDALRARRTYAATGDRIALEMTVNGQPMGSELPQTADREIAVRVEGQDSIAMIELVRNGHVIERHFPEDTATPPALPGRVKCRIQYGWGPWAALDLGRTCQWDVSVTLDEGRFVQAIPCFQSGPYEENMRDRLRLVSDRELHLKSFTSRVLCYAEDPTKAIVCEMEGGPQTVLRCQLRKPLQQTATSTLAELRDQNIVTVTDQFTSESYIIDRLIGPSEYSATVRWTDRNRDASASDWYYVRVTQHNGQLAWSSPVWVG